MGALQGTLSYKLFYVQGELEDGFKQKLVDKVGHRAFEPLDPEDEAEERWGWVIIDRPLYSGLTLDAMVYGTHINLGLRHDKYVIPSGLFKAHLQEAERAYLEDNGKAKLSRFERDDLKLLVRERLKKRFMPRMKVIDMSWDVPAKRVRFWSQSTKACETFQAYFEETFELALRPANPYVTALSLDGLDPELVADLAFVEPSNFTTAAP